MTAARPLTGAEIRELVGEVPERLGPDGPQHVVVIVGGSLSAWRGLRHSTEDVDSAIRLDDELRRAVEQVAAAHDLPAGWLNDSASMFLPATFERDDCEVLMEHPRWSPPGPRPASGAPKKSSTPPSMPQPGAQRHVC